MSESEEKGVTILDAVRRAKEIAAAAKANAAPPLNGDDAANRKRSHDEESEGGPAIKKPASESHGIGPSPAAGQIDPKAIARQAIMNLTCRVGLTQMVTVEIKIPNRLVGLVIGHQGEMISRLQSESGARIQVAPDGSEINGERLVTISGTQDTVEKAKSLVEKTVREVGLIDLPSITAAGHEVVEMMIPSNKIGLIIGKGGDMIKALQERAGCRMQMLQDGQYATTPEKPLRMTGNPESCRRARELVIELIEQKEMEARGLMMTNLGSGTGTLEVQVPRPMVGVIIGKSGECINNIQQTCGVRLQFLNDDLKSPYRAATISGSHDGIERAHKMVQDIISERSQGGGALMPGGRPFINLPNPTGPGVISTQLSVPSTKCGIVIGKSGETIRQLQVQSGCHIELDRGPDLNPNEKLFNIRGSPQAVQAAQNLIWQKCDMTPGTGIVGGSTAMNFAAQQPQGMGYQQPGQQMYQQPGAQQGGATYNPQQQVVAAAAAAAVQNPWGTAYNPYQQYAAQAQQGQAQGSTDANQAAWAAYYQQYYAAQAAAAAGQTAGQQPQQQVQQQQQQQPTTVATTAAGQQDYTAQWAEYYRQLGYSYPYQQPQQQQQQQQQPQQQPQQQQQQQQPGIPQQVQQVPQQQQQQPQPGQVQQMPPPGAMGQQVPMQQMQQMPPGMPGAPTESK